VNDGQIKSGVCGYVLSGGASSRFGIDKSQAELGGRTLLERTSELVAESAGSVTIVAPGGRYEHLSVRTISEPWPGNGPLGGILGALMDAEERVHRDTWCLVVGCDMPFLTREWLAHLCELARESRAQVVVPRSENGLEPLCACWNTQASSLLQHGFAAGVRKVTEAIKSLKFDVLEESAWKRFDTAGRLFWNMNTPADYHEAKSIIEAERR
jgi:molybdenum cofactor guanylyltransferase